MSGQADQVAWAMCQAQNVVVMTGAGISVSSGIPAFRDRMRALWSEFDPMEVASLLGYEANPEKVWSWHRKMRDIIATAKPNPSHQAIADLAALLPNCASTVITQNIDGLHSAAGSHPVIELHGNISRLRCHGQCGYGTTWDETTDSLRICPSCRSPVRPDVVWFEENLCKTAVDHARQAAEACDVFIVAGTSGLVQPAASLPILAREGGALLVEINPEETPITPSADIVLRGTGEEVLPDLLERVKKRVSSQTKYLS